MHTHDSRVYKEGNLQYSTACSCDLQPNENKLKMLKPFLGHSIHSVRKRPCTYYTRWYDFIKNKT